MPVRPRITQAELARQAKVSQMTVSLALRDHPSISAATKKRIHQLANKLGYRPDPALSSLVAYRQTVRHAAYHGTIAWFNNTHVANAHETWPGWKDFLEGARGRAEQLGYKIETLWMQEPGMTSQRANQILRSRGIRGLVLAPQSKLQWDLDMDWSELSVIRLGDYSTLPTDFNLAAADHYWAMQECLGRLNEKGYQSAGYVSWQYFEQRINLSYISAYQGWGTLHPNVKLVPAFLPDKFTKTAFLRWFKKHKPEVLILPNNQEIGRTLDWVRQDLNYLIPKDVAVCFTCIPLHFGPEWSGVDEGYTTIGARTLDYLVDMINRNEVDQPERPTRHLIHGRWVEGSTLPSR